MSLLPLLLFFSSGVTLARDIQYGDSFSTTLHPQGIYSYVGYEVRFQGIAGDTFRVDATAAGGGINSIEIVLSDEWVFDWSVGGRGHNQDSASHSAVATLRESGRIRVRVRAYLYTFDKQAWPIQIHGRLTLLSRGGGGSASGGDGGGGAISTAVPCQRATLVQVGGKARNATGSQTNIRSEATTGAGVVGTFPPNQLADVLDGPVNANGYTWVKIRLGAITGWTAEGDNNRCRTWLMPASEPTATPTQEPTLTPTATATATREPTATPSPTPTQEPTSTPTPTPTREPTLTPTSTATPTPAPPIAINYGDLVGGQLHGSSAHQLYTFTGEADDEIKISMIGVSDGIAPGLSLRDDFGVKLAEATGENGALIDGFSLPRGGMYTISANNRHDGSGYYSLALSLLARAEPLRVKSRFEVNQEAARAWADYRSQLIAEAHETGDMVITGASLGETPVVARAADVPALIAETMIEVNMFYGIESEAAAVMDEHSDALTLDALAAELALGCLGKVRSGRAASVYSEPYGEAYGQLGAGAVAIALAKQNNWFATAVWDQDRAVFKTGWLRLDDPALELQGSDCGAEAVDPAEADLDNPWRVADGCDYSNANIAVWLHATPSESGHKLALLRPDDMVTVTIRDPDWLYVLARKDFPHLSEGIRGYIRASDVKRIHISAGGNRYEYDGLDTKGPCGDRV